MSTICTMTDQDAADFIEVMAITETKQTGGMIVHRGRHPAHQTEVVVVVTALGDGAVIPAR